MREFSVSARGLPTVAVSASNWIVALGQGLEELGRAGTLERMACEVLPNGTVIARDVTSGMGYVIQQTGEPDEAESMPTAELAPLDDLDIRLEVLGEVGSRDAVCRAALEIAADLAASESGAVIVEERGYLRFTAVRGPHSDVLAGVRMPVGTGVAGFAMRTGRPVVLSDASHDERHCGQVDALTGYRTRAMVAVPVVHEERILGVLEVMNPREGGRYARSSVHRLQGVGRALGARLGALRE